MCTYHIYWTYRIAGYFANFTKAEPILENKIVKKQLMWEEAWFSISIREITFREQELNWLFAKYKRLENNPLYGTFNYACTSLDGGYRIMHVRSSAWHKVVLMVGIGHA